MIIFPTFRISNIQSIHAVENGVDSFNNYGILTYNFHQNLLTKKSNIFYNRERNVNIYLDKGKTLYFYNSKLGKIVVETDAWDGYNNKFSLIKNLIPFEKNYIHFLRNLTKISTITYLHTWSEGYLENVADNIIDTSYFIIDLTQLFNKIPSKAYDCYEPHYKIIRQRRLIYIFENYLRIFLNVFRVNNSINLYIPVALEK